MRASVPRIAALVLFLTILSACGDRPGSREVLRGATMGTTWSVVYETQREFPAEDIHARLSAELVAINDAFSTYITDSEISRLNAAAAATDTVVEQKLSQRFAEVLNAALTLGEQTGGAYDVTVGPLVDLWGFGPRDFDGQVPSAVAIDAAREDVGAGHLQWDASSRVLRMPKGYRVDLSSLAKGYAVDRLSALLADLGLENTLVEIGGELLARGVRPEGGEWRVAIESPNSDATRPLGALMLRDVAVATSGDYRNFFEVDGKRYSHLVDPRSGYPVDHELVSVTVVHESCMLADAWATALIVLGRERARAIAEEQGLAVQLVSMESGALEVQYSSGFDPYVRE